nr:antibiotic biosynthesis monooxygenase [candidate division Zixibacteria bacterium]
MIGRIWHGYTTPENADVYFNVLKTEVLPGIAKMKIPGYRSIQVLRRRLDNEVEFITVMWFDSLEDVKSFTGNDYEVAHVPARAREVLKRFDERSQHYELIEELHY